MAATCSMSMRYLISVSARARCALTRWVMSWLTQIAPPSGRVVRAISVWTTVPSLMYGMRPEPFAMLFQGFANFRHYRRLSAGARNLLPRLAQHRFPICVPDHPRVRRVDINVFPSGIENGQAIDGGIHGQRMRVYGVLAFCLMKLADSQPRGVAHDGNSKK